MRGTTLELSLQAISHVQDERSFNLESKSDGEWILIIALKGLRAVVCGETRS